MNLAHRSRTRQPNRISTPALDAWRAELAAGKRTIYTFDHLWRAACAELYVLEESWRADIHLAESRRIIRAAQKGRAA